ncbi:sensor histidine kinase [Fulvivirga lutea]|uniref:histidine kinase n=1 Tax=Fulvivirga lutea TaxID=2810512 RepID=A0A974WFM1_9BACT|nr:HAMP domain-containing sensor histidine kinase [Fulvivirga lutea]QSE97573.1 HAMP domain-containing histidine kinase [Fulvivirga lutea]
MSEITNFLSTLFDTSKWPARWHCGEWTSFHGWLYIISDIAIWAAYSVIPILIVYFITKRQELPFKNVLWLFVLFILTCGATHLADAVIFYVPFYQFSALLLFICAVISWFTVFAMFRVLPMALSLRAPSEYEKILDDRTSELNKITNKLKKQNSQLLSFAHITSHDLRSHVSSIHSLLALHSATSQVKEQKEYLEMLKNEADNLMVSITEMNDVIRINEGEDLKWELVSFDEMLIEAKKNLTGLLSEEVEIQSNFDDLTSIIYPRVYLKSILFNLLSNAIKFRNPDAQCLIKLRTIEVAGQNILTVTDNGLGIDMNKYGDKIFNKNKVFHGEKSNRGVGLYMIKNQIESLGGSISVSSEVGQGTKFTIIFNQNGNGI